MSATVVLFWLFAAVAIGSALLCVTRTSPVASALWLVVTLFQIAALFVLLDAQFIAVLQVLVYAGAIMVLFLFVIMLLGVGHPGASDIRGPLGLAAATLFAGALGLELSVLLHAPARAAPLGPGMLGVDPTRSMVAVVARPLFTTYLLPFEIASLLLLAAIVGAVVLAKREL